MTDMNKEREAIIRAAVAAMPHTNPMVADDLLGGFTMHTEADDIVAIFQAGRASLAASAAGCQHESDGVTYTSIPPKKRCKKCGSIYTLGEPKAASAGSEPVAYAIFSANGNIRLWSKARIPHPDAKPLYLHPSPPEGMVGGWIALPGTLPEPGTPVLLDIGKKYPIRAMWAAKHTVQACDDDTDWGEYVEEDDMYYAPEGWYEWNQCEDNHWRVTETPRAWTPLPPTNPAGSGKGA